MFVGVDWAEDHHDLCVVDTAGKVRAKGRVTDDLSGVARAHDLIASAVPDEVDEVDVEVVVGIETDRGLLVRALVTAGYRVLAVNPLSVDRYRDRARVSGAKSDPGDARVLADMVRTDAHQHRPVAADSDLAEAIKLVARSHQSAIWSRRRLANQLRSALREFFPAALVAFDDLTSADAIAVLGVAPTPEAAKGLSRSKIASALRRGGRQLNIDLRAEAIQAALRTEHLTQPPMVADAYGNIVASLVKVIAAHTTQIAELAEVLEAHFGQHPDATILRSLPGLGVVTGARVLAEFGDDPARYADARARRNYAGTSPLTVASGTRRTVRARHIRNRRLADALHWWAFNAITRSPGARALYDRRRTAGDTHSGALRVVANRLVAILHGCLRTRTPYDEATAWAHRNDLAA
ncbi:IS110 family transposase [Iamia majanohamensis]|uniref:IS110 family transposase n=1 Tax=Iamia majanohamensis TaxID=467976 RepID=A0AAE9Y8W6_9ACTN|nr:IS110 family transposase [Iamia majanohamensis]WCO69230.1 IS110 family transposase [Iamia majanohamensis]